MNTKNVGKFILLNVIENIFGVSISSYSNTSGSLEEDQMLNVNSQPFRDLINFHEFFYKQLDYELKTSIANNLIASFSIDLLVIPSVIQIIVRNTSKTPRSGRHFV